MYTFTKFVQYLPFFVQMCIILATFVYLQCKLALQVQSKHIKIFKKNKKNRNKNKAQTNWHTWREKKKEKKKVHLTNWINQKKYYSWAFGSFYIVNRYASLHKYLKEKKKKNRKLENVLKTQELFRPLIKSYGSIDFTLT